MVNLPLKQGFSVFKHINQISYEIEIQELH